MSLPAPQPFFDAQAYLAWEAEQSTKHEYHDGEVFAMAGASDAHVTVAGNVYMALRNHLRGSPCSVARPLLCTAAPRPSTCRKNGYCTHSVASVANGTRNTRAASIWRASPASPARPNAPSPTRQPS